jgi:ethanolaminephosphotransferase
VIGVDLSGAFRRRTHQSGPLGELFDHGVDACNTTLEVLLFAATMNLGQSWNTVLTLFACELAAPTSFFLAMTNKSFILF